MVSITAPVRLHWQFVQYVHKCAWFSAWIRDRKEECTRLLGLVFFFLQCARAGSWSNQCFHPPGSDQAQVQCRLRSLCSACSAALTARALSKHSPRKAPLPSAGEIITLHHLLPTVNVPRWLRDSSTAVFVTTARCGVGRRDEVPSLPDSALAPPAGSDTKFLPGIPSPSARSPDDFHYFIATTSGSKTTKTLSDFKLQDSSLVFSKTALHLGCTR